MLASELFNFGHGEHCLILPFGCTDLFAECKSFFLDKIPSLCKIKTNVRSFLEILMTEKEIVKKGEANRLAIEDAAIHIILDQHPYKKILPLILEVQGETAEEFFGNAFRIVIDELGKQPEFINLMFIELVEFKGKHGAVMLREIAPRILPIFEKVIKARKDLRVTNPAVLMRSFFGSVISYFITEMVISNSVIS